MWIFLPGGLLMPASLPTIERDGLVADPAFTNDGIFDMQVRGRVESHLRNFIRDYVDPLGYAHSDIEFTPHMDYNVRFYMDQTEFAECVAAAVRDIDFLKFKPTAERRDESGELLYEDGEKYHSVLNSIWGSVTRLGSPGGFWGRLSGSNPNGYSSVRSLGSNELYGGNKSHRKIGDSFYGGGDFDGEGWAGFGQRSRRGFVDRDDELLDELLDDTDELDLDWIPDEARLVEKILNDVSDIPYDQWEEHLSEQEFKLVQPFMYERLAREARNKRRNSKRGTRKTSRRNKQQRRPS